MHTSQQGAASLSSLDHDSMNPSQQDSPANPSQAAEAANAALFTAVAGKQVGEMLHLS